MVALSGRWGRLAPCLQTMVAEADRIAPRRSQRSDGSVGDLAHRLRSSYHNPSGGYVDALDLTDDPARGFDVHLRARAIAAKRDPRIDHIISNRQIWSASKPYWRRYYGINGHTQHAHFANKRNATARNDRRAWWSGATATPSPGGFPMALSEKEQDDMHRWAREGIILTREIGKKVDRIHSALGLDGEEDAAGNMNGRVDALYEGSASSSTKRILEKLDDIDAKVT